MHQNERLGRYKTIAKLAAIKLAVQNEQRSGCAISSAASEEFYKILSCMNMRRDLDPLRVKFSGGLRNLRARGLRDIG